METPIQKIPSNLDIIIVEHDLGAPGPGASSGPQAVLQALSQKAPHIDTKSVKIIHAPAPIEDAEKTPHAKSLARTLATMTLLRDAVTQSLKKGRFPMVLSGDHSTAVGTIAGIKDAFPHLEMGVVWFDAHTDIHSPYTTHSGNLHGMPLAGATSIDNKPYQRQPLTVLEKELWSDIKNLSTICPMIELENIVFVGIRDMEPEERDLVKSRDCLILDAAYVQEQTPAELVAKTKNHLRHCDMIYLSFDIDCLDKSLVPGTGTPVEGGPDAEKVLEIVSMLSKWERVVCFELSEVNPALDKSGKTLDISTRVARNALSFLS